MLWGDLVLDGPELVVPHPEFRRRAFVLAPLTEIAGETRDPVTGMTINELLNQPGVEGTATKGEAIFATDGHG